MQSTDNKGDQKINWQTTKIFDISANMNTYNFQGKYKDFKKSNNELVKYHEPDFNQVFERARKNGVRRLLLPGSCTVGCRSAMNMCH